MQGWWERVGGQVDVTRQVDDTRNAAGVARHGAGDVAGVARPEKGRQLATGGPAIGADAVWVDPIIGGTDRTQRTARWMSSSWAGQR